MTSPLRLAFPAPRLAALALLALALVAPSRVARADDDERHHARARPLAHADRLFGSAPETVVRRALILAGSNPHGELVVLRRGDSIVVRTTLVSALLGRGLQSIRRKEQARWPEGVAGHEDSEEYLEALEEGEDAARAGFLSRKNPNDDRRKMMMELVSSRDAAFFAVYAIDARRSGDVFDVLAARPVVVKDASRAYVEGAMRTQAGQAFKIEGAELEALFAELAR
jgi:hypothetical protein